MVSGPKHQTKSWNVTNAVAAQTELSALQVGWEAAYCHTVNPVLVIIESLVGPKAIPSAQLKLKLFLGLLALLLKMYKVDFNRASPRRPQLRQWRCALGLVIRAHIRPQQKQPIYTVQTSKLVLVSIDAQGSRDSFLKCLEKALKTPSRTWLWLQGLPKYGNWTKWLQKRFQLRHDSNTVRLYAACSERLDS